MENSFRRETFTLSLVKFFKMLQSNKFNLKKCHALLLICSFFLSASALAQDTTVQKIKRPKLVVGIVIDQMRWDYLYRYSDRYSNNGFKRLINEGFSCENTMIPYAPTVTACGHTCIFTGSVPAINGITGNNWWDYDKNKEMYCTEDESVQTVGSHSSAGKMSPQNMLVTTITDELKLATNFKSKVIGIALKDRAAILPAGHSADAAYWYDDQSGNWISSSYYSFPMNELPGWVKQFNTRKLVDSLLANNWNTLYPVNTYTQSTDDNKPYERKFPGETSSAFPHNFSSLTDRQKNTAIKSTPLGNTFTLAFAESAIEGENLGIGNQTDFLTISCSSPDYIGHQFGPNSIENEDDYLRLDADLSSFLNYLDEKYGSGNYLLFLTADHGVAHVPGFLKENKIPSGFINLSSVANNLNAALKAAFGFPEIIVDADNYQLTLNHARLDSAKISRENIINFLLPMIQKIPGIANEFDIKKISETTLPEVQKKMYSNGYFSKRCGDIQLILEPGWIDGGNTGTTHGLWNPYDAHIPLLWYGWGIKKGASNREVYMTDIAPTVAALLHIQMPNGCVGKVIQEVMKKK